MPQKSIISPFCLILNGDFILRFFPAKMYRPLVSRLGLQCNPSLKWRRPRHHHRRPRLKGLSQSAGKSFVVNQLLHFFIFLYFRFQFFFRSVPPCLRCVKWQDRDTTDTLAVGFWEGKRKRNFLRDVQSVS